MIADLKAASIEVALGVLPNVDLEGAKAEVAARLTGVVVSAETGRPVKGAAVEAFCAPGYPKGAEAILIAEIDGTESEVAYEARRIAEIASAQRATLVHECATQEERARAWSGRKAAFGAMGRISPDMVVMDAVIPRTQLPGVLTEIYRLSDHYGLPVANVFHAGDGNLHPLILFDSRRQEQVDKIIDFGGDIMKVCVAVGGALSGEHGIGIEKKEFMDLVFNDVDLDAMMQVKNVFNPRGLLNPSKVFPTRRSCTEIGKGTTTDTQTIGKRVEAVLLRGTGDH